MKNPWTRKNPLLSMWLSGANAVLGATRGRVSAQAKRRASAAAAKATRQASDLWLASMMPAAATRRRKKKRS